MSNSNIIWPGLRWLLAMEACYDSGGTELRMSQPGVIFDIRSVVDTICINISTAILPLPTVLSSYKHQLSVSYLVIFCLELLCSIPGPHYNVSTFITMCLIFIPILNDCYRSGLIFICQYSRITLKAHSPLTNGTYFILAPFSVQPALKVVHNINTRVGIFQSTQY